MRGLVDPAEKSIFIADFRGQVSIGQVWVRTQIKSKPDVGPTGLQQIEKKVTLYSLAKTRDAHSHST